MRLHRLRVSDFAGIQETEIEFGPGLNVLYGPNDLGKSTLADAIRLGFLLPHTSTHIEDYVPWTGGRNPVIEMTFETEPQRIWRVRKEFRRGGSALLQESKDGVDFDDVARARTVDGKLRELLRWGIAEPGGPGGSRGLPESFLATVLLSTQSDVAAVLNDSLQSDPTGTGRDRIAAALQAVTQDPLFAALLRATQARRDEAYTDRGAKKTARGSVFKAAADRLNQVRDEREALLQVVEESEGVETQLRGLIGTRGRREEAVTGATEQLVTLERLAAEAAQLAAAAEQVRLAREDVQRIERIGVDVDTARRTVATLARTVGEAEQGLREARAQHAAAAAAFDAAEDAARSAGSDPAATDIVARQRLELRSAAADHASRDAQQRIDAAIAAQTLVAAAVTADGEHKARLAEVNAALQAVASAFAKQQALDDRRQRVDLLERALDLRVADEQVAIARGDVDKEDALQVRSKQELAALDSLAGRRASMVVPPAASLGPMRRLDTDLAAARGALNVGLVVTVTPLVPLSMQVRQDTMPASAVSTNTPIDLEADTEVDIDIAGVATVRVRGGRREAQNTAAALEARWRREVVPHLNGARVTDLESLTATVAEAEGLDAAIKAKQADLDVVRREIASLADSARALREASSRAEACRLALGNVSAETLTADLTALGKDPMAALRQRRQQLAIEIEKAREAVVGAGSAHLLSEERTRQSVLALNASIAARDAALAAFASGTAAATTGDAAPGRTAGEEISLNAALSAAQTALATASAERQRIGIELAALDSTIAAASARIESGVRDARTTLERSAAAVEAAQARRTTSIAEHAAQVGRLEALQQQRDAEDRAAATTRSGEAMVRHAALPVPARIATDAEVATARAALTRAKSDLEAIDREIQRAHGALGQVGGAVARERLRDTTEAFFLAEAHEREIEADYEAWRLLLDQMKEADAAQASNLGQALAPAIAGRFEALTSQRYESVRLTAQLGTEGVVVAGAVRSPERISIGTREQLSTLYRLAIAEYLATTVVLDDQLVQSDGRRMDWFRALLAEKARAFQIVVFTCRESDYLAPGAMVTKGKATHRDSDSGFVRAIDLGRAIRRQ